MRNRYIKLLDEYGVRDGVLREMLAKGPSQQSLDAVQQAIEKRESETLMLRDLSEELVSILLEEEFKCSNT